MLLLDNICHMAIFFCKDNKKGDAMSPFCTKAYCKLLEKIILGAVKKVPQQGSQCLKALATKN